VRLSVAQRAVCSYREGTNLLRMTNDKTPITVAYGDGIGPEIMTATLEVLNAAGARIAPERIEIGEKVYLAGNTTGIGPEAWESLRRTRVFLKAPITTPQGGGVKSLNVTIRKTLGLFANVRPCRAYAPFVGTHHPFMDVIIVRENEEDLYAGIEHQHTDEVVQCLKIISRPGSEKIIRYAFEYARSRGRRKVTCFSKDNIMKLSDGLFHKVFDEIGAEYPEIEKQHMIVDIGMARMASMPERFDVVVLPNLYGDILSDVAAEVSGSVGLAGSANIGDLGAMFEAVHGSAPDIAGKNVANPSGLLLSAVKMLAHMGQGETAARVHNAWLRTLEDGIHTGDIYREGYSEHQVGTQEFAAAVIERLGQESQQLGVAHYAAQPMPQISYRRREAAKKELVGIDVFFAWRDDAESLAAKVQQANSSTFELLVITNRGVKVWPEGFPETFCTDHWRCRFMAKNGTAESADVIRLLERVAGAGLDFVKTEHLYNFDGQPRYSLAQGQ
jgi:isocitrate dehydrogenase